MVLPHLIDEGSASKKQDMKQKYYDSRGQEEGLGDGGIHDYVITVKLASNNPPTRNIWKPKYAHM